VQCCTRLVRGQPTHAVFEKYLDAVRQGAGALPLLIPALDEIPPETLVAAAPKSDMGAPRELHGSPLKSPQSFPI
jgi:hypothetical protein